MAKKLFILLVMVLCTVLSVPLLNAVPDKDTQEQINELQEQIKLTQEQYQKQLDALQVKVGELQAKLETQTAQPSEKKATTVAHHIPRPSTVVDRTFDNNGGPFRLRDAVGLTEESNLNIGGEMKMRYRQNNHASGSKPGFQFYELELFLDAALNEYSSVYAEYNLMHETKPEPEDVWMDFHTKPGDIAATGNTGIKVGNFHYPFGWDNDDNEGYVYGGRSTINTALIRGESIDGWKLRERQLGIDGNYNFDLGPINLAATAGVFNGSGSWSLSPSDNDNLKDFVGRLEAKFKDIIIGISGLYAPHTKGFDKNENNKVHVRDITRYGINFKYPDVPFPAQDISLGGRRWMIWGEWLWGKNKANSKISQFDYDQDLYGGYVELDISILPDRLLGFFRTDYYVPDKHIDKNYIYALTPGVKLNFLGSSFLIVEYEHYAGGKSATGSILNDDRIALELSTMF